MKTHELLDEIEAAAETIKAHTEYLEALNGEADEADYLGDGEGRYEMRVVLSVTSTERSRETAKQHCRQLAGTLREDSAVGRFDVADTSVIKLEDSQED